MLGYEIRKISYQDTKPFILNIHYARRMPSISYSFGLFFKNCLVGIVTYGTPASPALCRGICGEQNKHLVLELNRLVLKNNVKNEASFLVAKSLKLLPSPRIIVSYADTEQNHIGVVYQACNFLFTGTTKPRTDMASSDGKHPRHHLGDRSKRVFRSAKHRYVYFVGSKIDKSNFSRALNYAPLSYPKLNITNNKIGVEKQ